ncbi:hypothetical protein Tco_0360522 [Tanacetum coccineum]
MTRDKILEDYWRKVFNEAELENEKKEDPKEYEESKTNAILKIILEKADETWCVLWKPSQDFTRPLGPPSGLKGLLHSLNAIVIPMKDDSPSLNQHVLSLLPLKAI